MKYGDYDNVTKDSKTIAEIFYRQGASLILEVLAERVGEAALRFDINGKERALLRDKMVNELREEINDRI